MREQPLKVKVKSSFIRALEFGHAAVSVQRVWSSAVGKLDRITHVFLIMGQSYVNGFHIFFVRRDFSTVIYNLYKTNVIEMLILINIYNLFNRKWKHINRW